MHTDGVWAFVLSSDSSARATAMPAASSPFNSFPIPTTATRADRLAFLNRARACASDLCQVGLDLGFITIVYREWVSTQGGELPLIT